MNSKPRLFVACDFQSKHEFSDFLNKIEGINEIESLNFEVFLKIGLELFIAEGVLVIDEAKKRGFGVFLDLKLHDIPNTVSNAVAVVSRFGVEYLTIHLSSGENAIRKAVEVSKKLSGPKILGVTVLTSMDDNLSRGVLPDCSLSNTSMIENWVLKLASNAVLWGCDGIICSAQELVSIRQDHQHFPLIVPGIRWDNSFSDHGSILDDQKRVMTPVEAIQFGATGIVVGRPIIRAKDPLGVILSASRQINYK